MTIRTGLAKKVELKRPEYSMPTHWKMRDGREIEIIRMEDSHLTNAILMCHRIATRAGKFKGRATFMRDLGMLAHGIATVGGDMARDALESEMTHLKAVDAPAWDVLRRWSRYFALCAEAEHRSDLEEFRASQKHGPNGQQVRRGSAMAKHLSRVFRPDEPDPRDDNWGSS